MCASLGVNPMSSNKTFSAKLGFGSFYTELGVQVLDICMRTRSSNGGLIGLQELTMRVISLRGSNSGGIETDDILRAVRSLQVENLSLWSVSCQNVEFPWLMMPPVFQLLDPCLSLVNISVTHCLSPFYKRCIPRSPVYRHLHDFISSQRIGERSPGR